jgi:hypothetical protein
MNWIILLLILLGCGNSNCRSEDCERDNYRDKKCKDKYDLPDNTYPWKDYPDIGRGNQDCACDKND